MTRSGRAVRPLVFELTAPGYHARRDRPLRIVVARDPGGHRPDQAGRCTDLGAEAAVVLATSARRRALAVTFRDAKPGRGLEGPPRRASRAVQRTAALSRDARAPRPSWRGAGRIVRPDPTRSDRPTRAG